MSSTSSDNNCVEIILQDIYNNLGRYRSEKQYSDALEEIFKKNKIKYKREKALPISFDGEKSRRNIPDFIVENKIIFDVKAKSFITKEDYFQMCRYLTSFNKKWLCCTNDF